MIFVVDHRVIERPVGLDVTHARARHAAHRLECAQLIEHVSGELGWVHGDEAPTKTSQVAIADLGADDDPAFGGGRAGALQGEGVPGVEAAGDIRAGDDVEHGLVVAEPPGAERLAEVGVEINDQGPLFHVAGALGEVPGQILACGLQQRHSLGEEVLSHPGRRTRDGDG